MKRWSAPSTYACATLIVTVTEVETEMEGLLAVCVQHEIDHLDGKLFVDYISEAKRSRIRKRLLRDQRHRATA